MRQWVRTLAGKFERDHEDGFVAVFIALILVVMLIFAAFTVDFGSWYTRSAELKRGADAAALAGVVWMPEFDQAKQFAEAAAKRNGFVDGVNNISVTVAEVAENNRQLKVTIRDNKAKQFFSKLVTQGQSIGRSSLAEYVLPVPLGSPKNTFGTGDILTGADRENFWAAVSGYCTGHEGGDKKLSKYESYSTGADSCNNGSGLNADYDPDGYLYAIQVPQNVTGTLNLEAYDAPYFNSGSADGNTASGNQVTTTTFEVYDRNVTPLDLSYTSDPVNQLLPKHTFTTGQTPATYQNKWTSLHAWTNPLAGIYYLRVKTSDAAGNPDTNNSHGTNTFGIRAYVGSTFATCTTIVGLPGYSAACPGVYAVSDMAISAKVDASVGPVGTFYLAQIDPVHAGKTMRIHLFDAGENANSIKIFDPNGASVAFGWSVSCSPEIPLSGGVCSGTATAASGLNVNGGAGTALPAPPGLPQPYTGLNRGWKFNDRDIVIDIPLDVNYVATYGTKTWWKVQYDFGATGGDNTTWSVNIVGDPVHLLK